MGSHSLGTQPRFNWYPQSGDLETLDLNEALTEFDAQQVYISDAAQSASHSVYRTAFSTAWQVRIVLERFHDTDGSREAKIRALLDHLERGGWVAFSTDHSRSWATRADAAPQRLDTTTATEGNRFAVFGSGTPLPSIGDHLIIQSPMPGGRIEQVRVQSYNAGTETVTYATGGKPVYDHTGDTLIRWRGFFPRLVLPPGATTVGALSAEYQYAWTLDLTLQTTPGLELPDPLE